MTDPNTAAESPVHALIQQREQLRTWIAKLDEVAAGAPTRVAERIRQDYSDRLARVTTELGGHRDEIGRSLDSMRAQLAQAEERESHASDALEEMRLRHLIGELPADEWDTQRVRLEGELEGVRDEAARVRAEVERLAGLAAEVAGDGVPAPAEAHAFESVAEDPAAGAADAPEEDDDAQGEPIAFLDTTAPADDAGEDTSSWLNDISLDEPEAPRADAPLDPPAAAAAEEASSATWDPFGNEFGGEPETPQSDTGDLPWLETPAKSEDAWTTSTEGDGLEFLNDLGSPTPEAPASGGDLAEDDLAFLEELDRAISGAPAASRPSTPPPPTPPAAAEGAKPGTSGGPLLCKECGAINEPHSWYCEICGSEL
jgi:hypothetical protein